MFLCCHFHSPGVSISAGITSDPKISAIVPGTTVQKEMKNAPPGKAPKPPIQLSVLKPDCFSSLTHLAK